MKSTLENVTKKDVYYMHRQIAVAYLNHSKHLLLQANRKLGNRAMSEDLVQLTFLKAWLYLRRGGKIEVMKAFLYHVLNRLIIDEYRKRTTTSLDALMDSGFNLSSDTLERELDYLEGKEAMQLISKLPTKYQKILTMRYLDGLSLEEMSQLTGQSRNAVAVQAHRGLEVLRNLHLRTTNTYA